MSTRKVFYLSVTLFLETAHANQDTLLFHVSNGACLSGIVKSLGIEKSYGLRSGINKIIELNPWIKKHGDYLAAWEAIRVPISKLENFRDFELRNGVIFLKKGRVQPFCRLGKKTPQPLETKIANHVPATEPEKEIESSASEEVIGEPEEKVAPAAPPVPSPVPSPVPPYQLHLWGGGGVGHSSISFDEQISEGGLELKNRLSFPYLGVEFELRKPKAFREKKLMIVFSAPIQLIPPSNADVKVPYGIQVYPRVSLEASLKEIVGRLGIGLFLQKKSELGIDLKAEIAEGETFPLNEYSGISNFPFIYCHVNWKTFSGSLMQNVPAWSQTKMKIPSDEIVGKLRFTSLKLEYRLPTLRVLSVYVEAFFNKYEFGESVNEVSSTDYVLGLKTSFPLFSVSN